MFDRLVHQGPQPLGGLELGAVWGQEYQRDPVGHDQALGPVPAGVVEHEDDVARAPRPNLAREAGEQGLEEPLAQAGGQEPDRLARGRLDEGGDVQPLVTVVPERDRPLARGPLGLPSIRLRRTEPSASLAQTRRRTGFSPRRCSSSAQTSTGRSGCAALAWATALSSPF